MLQGLGDFDMILQNAEGIKRSTSLQMLNKTTPFWV
jgi:hypothetical protein